MEDVSKRFMALAAAAALLAAAGALSASATEAPEGGAPRFARSLYSAALEIRGARLRFELGAIERQEAGRSRIMATISSARGVQAVCERVLTNALPADPDSIPMTCTGSLFAPASASVTFYFANSLKRPLLRFSPSTGGLMEAVLNPVDDPVSLLPAAAPKARASR